MMDLIKPLNTELPVEIFDLKKFIEYEDDEKIKLCLPRPVYTSIKFDSKYLLSIFRDVHIEFSSQTDEDIKVICFKKNIKIRIHE